MSGSTGVAGTAAPFSSVHPSYGAVGGGGGGGASAAHSDTSMHSIAAAGSDSASAGSSISGSHSTRYSGYAATSAATAPSYHSAYSQHASGGVRIGASAAHPAAGAGFGSSFSEIDTTPDFQSTTPSPFTRLDHLFHHVVLRQYQRLLDRSTPHQAPRWIAFAALFVLFGFRILYLQGFYVVAYALGIYLLNILLLFLSPKFDPAFAELEESHGLGNDARLADVDDGSNVLGGAGASGGAASGAAGGSGGGAAKAKGLLPVKADEEFRPFIRRLPEFKFWHSATVATTIALVCTFIGALDVPVFWPILLLYFILLFCLTMRRQIHHMVKYKYVPFDFGKKSYSSRGGGGGGYK